MPKIIIQNLFKGVAKNYASGPTNAIEGKEGEYSRTSGIDFFREGFVGHMTTAQIFGTAVTDSGSALNSLPRAVAVNADASSFTTPIRAFFILGGLSGTGPRIAFMRLDTDLVTGSDDIAAHSGHNFTTLPTGTGFWGEDIILYDINGTKFLLISYNDNVDGDVARIDISGSSPASIDSDFMSTSPAGAASLSNNLPHRMVEGPDKILYITNGQYLNAFDGFIGTNGTLRTQVYDAGAGWTIVDLRVDKNFLVVYMTRDGSDARPTFSGVSRVAYWQPGEIGQGIVYEQDDFFVRSGFEAFGSALVFSSGKNQTIKLSTPQGTVLAEAPVGQYGTPPQPSSIETYQGNLLWIPGDSISAFVCQYGGGGFHVPYLVNDGSNNATAIGVLRNIQDNKLYVGGLFSSTYRLVFLNNSGDYSTTAQDLRTRLYPLSRNAVIRGFDFFFSQMASSSSVTFSLFQNYAAMSVGGSDDLLNLALTQAAQGTLTEHQLNRTIPNTSSFYMNIRLTGQISVRAIVVDWKPLK